jgi:hypothetical protein
MMNKGGNKPMAVTLMFSEQTKQYDVEHSSVKGVADITDPASSDCSVLRSTHVPVCKDRVAQQRPARQLQT